MLEKCSFALTFLVVLTNCIELQYISFWDYNPFDFAGWTNFAFTSNLTQIRIGSQLGINHLFSVESIFFRSGNATINGSLIHPLILRSNYLNEWNNKLSLFKELYYINKSIFGFFLGDELVWNGLNPIDLNTAAQCIRNDFPNATIYTNEATAPMENGRTFYNQYYNYSEISSYLDWFSIDMYHFDGTNNGFVDTVSTFYDTYIFPKMNLTYQYGILVPGSFGSNNNSNCNEECYDQMCQTDALNFYELAKNDTRIIGIAAWHWLYCEGCIKFHDEIGTKMLNITKQAWMTIGKQIVSNFR